MRRTIGFETDDRDSNTDTESFIEINPRRMSNHEMETSPSVGVTSEKFARQNRTVNDPIPQ